MAKSSEATKPATETAPAVNPATPTATGDGKPKKKRTPGIKYKTRLETVPVGPSDNPLDQKAVPHRGGFKFPGLIFENTLAGCIVKIPAKAAYAVNPTIREIFKLLTDTFDKPSEESAK